MERVISYIDGFNLSRGLKQKYGKKYYWLDLSLLSQNLLKKNQQLNHTKYFTSRIKAVKHDPYQHHRQSHYIDALLTRDNLSLHYGHYLKKAIQCRNCKVKWDSYEEKKTDVNIAVELIKDAYQDNFDTALLMSGDSDLTSPVQTIRELFPSKKVIIAFPPMR